MKIQTEFLQAQTKRFAEEAHDMLSFTMKAGSEAMASWSSVLPAKTKP